MSLKSISIALITFTLTATPMATQLAQAGTFIGNPAFKTGPSVVDPGARFSTGKRRGGGGHSKSITPVQDCWINAQGFEQCDNYLIWCPQEGEACVNVY